MIQKVYLIHDYLYADKRIIPKELFDGKDTVKEKFIIVDERITSEPSEWHVLYDTYNEAKLELMES